METDNIIESNEIKGDDKMIVAIRMYYFPNNEMKLWSNSEKKYNIMNIHKILNHFYNRNQYAKRIDKEWICQDYRIDQQRPQRNVYSEVYLNIYSMTEMEEKVVDNLIRKLEKNREYPTVYDDGENAYYEKTIYCPKCGKRRKVLTSKTHCEFCGFEFDKAKRCPKCNGLNLKGSKECRECGYEFRKESFIKNNDFEVEKNKYHENIRCPKCNERKSKYFSVCKNCGFDYSKKKKCKICGEWVDKNDNYCCHCGNSLITVKVCSNCGEENNKKNNYCNYCGNKLK